MENENIAKDVAVTLVKETAKDIYEDALQPTAKNVGGFFETLSGFFNHVVMHPLKKLNAQYKQKAIAFEKEMEEKYNCIPNENKAEPQLHIVGPTMESLKYNIMDEDLAEMFSNLLVSNMDNRTQSLCTPAFVKVIEQLSPIDARVFRTIFLYCKSSQNIEICQATLHKNDDENNIIKNEYVPLYFVNIKIEDLNPNDISKSIQNLTRLGLLNIDFLRWRNNDEIYSQILENDYIKALISWARKITGNEYVAKVSKKGLLELNDFARDFAKVCLR